jgi:hypothetical protein
MPACYWRGDLDGSTFAVMTLRSYLTENPELLRFGMQANHRMMRSSFVGFLANGYAPQMEDGPPPDEVRSAVEVAQRCLSVFAVIGLAFGAERAAVRAWLSENDLWNELAPSEAGFVDTPTPSEKQLINAGWLSERLIVLLWALGKVARLPSGDRQCEAAIF